MKQGRLLTFPSRFSGKVHVLQKGPLRLMFLGERMDIVQTRMDLRRPDRFISPYQKCLVTALTYFKDPFTEVRKAVIIGLGGGTLTRFFQMKMPHLHFDSVDIDPVVVAVARRFFFVKETATYRSYAMDGRKFLAQSPHRYDLVILDAFDATASLPRALASVEFFTLVREKLTPYGVLVMNFLLHDRQVYRSLYKTLRQVFPAVVRLPLFTKFDSKNVLLLAPADPARRPSGAVAVERGESIARRWGVQIPVRRCMKTFDADRLKLKDVPVFRDVQGK